MSIISAYRNILCIRADNMGDVIMSSPAFRAMKETFGSRVTLLTSTAGAGIAPFLDSVDDVLVMDLPWVRHLEAGQNDLVPLIEEIKGRNFDAALIFTVYSQSALPAALLAYMAGIPVRAAYARENPYALLTHWVPDEEPFERIEHQVQRDLNLVHFLGAGTEDDRLGLRMTAVSEKVFYQKLYDLLPDVPGAPYFVLHPGVSEAKRRYPAEHWIEAGKAIVSQYNLPVLISGSQGENTLAERIAKGIGCKARSVAGAFTLEEFIHLIDKAHCVISVNTSTVHIAAARQTPVVVLYAQTNPQHTPWKGPHVVLPFSIPGDMQSKNVIVRYVSRQLYTDFASPRAGEILSAVASMLAESPETGTSGCAAYYDTGKVA